MIKTTGYKAFKDIPVKGLFLVLRPYVDRNAYRAYLHVKTSDTRAAGLRCISVLTPDPDDCFATVSLQGKDTYP